MKSPRPTQEGGGPTSSDCRVSRYTEPRKFKGMESWKTRPLIITRSPTVRAPPATPKLAMYIMPVRATEKMRFCPAFRKARELVFWMAAAWYFFRASS